MKRILFILILTGLIACTPATISHSPERISDLTLTPAPLAASPSPVPAAWTRTPVPPTPTETASPVPPTPSLGYEAWKLMPVIPLISDNARQIYLRGLAMGRDPHRFSKAGDCESTTGWYLSEFDSQPSTYRLGEYAYLQTTIDYYAGSFERESLAVRRGANTSSMLTSLWADPAQCQKGESMLACEYRVHNPSIVIIAVGSNDIHGVNNFEEQMRYIIEFTISNGILPILSTKADNAEGNHRVNTTIGKLAYEYDIPLWNFWWAVQPLPDHGLDSDGIHLTFAGNLFDNPSNMEKAWPWRNLTALQTLDAVRKAFEPLAP